METTEKELTAKEAIDAAFGQFEEFFKGIRVSNTLLEELEYEKDDRQWRVTIGFDVGRTKTIGNQLAFFDKTVEPIRETRTFWLNAADGTFVRMD